MYFGKKQVRAFEDLELEVDDAVMRTGREMLIEEQKQKHGGQAEQKQNDDGISGTSNIQAASSNDGNRGIVGEGAAVGAVGSGGGVGVTSGLSLAGDPAVLVPTAPHRRLRQAVLLAQKLLRKEGELELARRQLAEVGERCEGLRWRQMTGGMSSRSTI